MHIERPDDLNAKIADALAALRLWVLTLFAWLADVIPSRALRLLLQKSIREARQDVKTLVFAKMLWRARNFPEHLRPGAQPAAISAPRGFHLRRKRLTIFRLCTRCLRLRSLRDIRRVIDNIDDVVTRALNRVPMCIVTHILVAARIPACVLSDCAIAPAAEAADTS